MQFLKKLSKSTKLISRRDWVIGACLAVLVVQCAWQWAHSRNVEAKLSTIEQLLTPPRPPTPEQFKLSLEQDLNIYLQEGKEYLIEGDFARAAEAFNSAIVLDPENIAAIAGLRASERALAESLPNSAYGNTLKRAK